MASAANQAEERGGDGEQAKRGLEQQRRQREEDPEERHEPSLRHRPVDRQVDRIRAGSAREARKRIRGEEQEGVQVRGVAEVRGEETVQRARDAPGRERDEPGHEHGQESGEAPEHEPDEVGEREQQPEEDRQARAPQVVRDVEPDRPLQRRLTGLGRQGRVAVGIAPGEQEEVARHLGGVAEPVHGEVAQPVRHPSRRERGEPAEERNGRERAARLVGVRLGLRAAAGAATSAEERRAQDRREQERRKRQHEAQPHGPAGLPRGLGHHDVDRVAPCGSPEARDTGSPPA